MEASCDTYIEGRGEGLFVFMRLVEVLVIRGFGGEKLWNNLGVAASHSSEGLCFKERNF